jgi:HPt (histidine-containing phosphotransfer) domain-containing protein
VLVGDFQKLMDKAHSIKGSAAYAGASRISNDSFWIQVCYEKGEYVNMIKHYCNLLEHSAQFRLHWRKYYHKYHKKVYKEEPEDFEIPVPYGWRLERVGEEEFKLHVPDDYLEIAQKAENANKPPSEVDLNSFYSAKDEGEEEEEKRSNNYQISIYKSFEDDFKIKKVCYQLKYTKAF